VLASLIIATRNPGKVREMRDVLQGFVPEVLSLDDVPEVTHDLPETGDTFAANAEQKAAAVLTATGKASLADDSGLEVTSLSGFPGVKSARWHEGSDQDRCEALLDKMNDAPDRSARFVCVLCLSLPNEPSQLFEGVIEGRLTEAPAGTDGFGYDPLFVPNGQTKTLAELGIEYKKLHSHRALALQKLLTYFANL